MTMRRALVLISAVSLAACDDSSPAQPSTSIATIRATTSFGFCVGYCQTSLEITSERMVFVEESGGRPSDTSLPPKRSTASISAEEWQALMNAVDRKQLEALPDTIGCPDCADGGAESLEVGGPDWRRRIVFEYNQPLKELQPLLDRVRALRKRFKEV